MQQNQLFYISDMEKYTEKKKRNQVFQNFINKFVGEKQMDLIKDCNTFLAFVTDKEQTKKETV